jgi:predicted dehydrogenase
MLKHVLICGLGSIGWRHLRHLRRLEVQRIDAWRTGRATLRNRDGLYPDEVFSSLDTALDERPQLVIVSNPTSLHLPTALQAVSAGCHVLIEKPISNSLDGIATLDAAAAAQGRKVAVGCNLRFHPLLADVAAKIGNGDFGAVHNAQMYFDANLPSWHPWEDYRNSYAARKCLGGGASLTHVHEIDIALWWFGDVSASTGMHGVAKPLGTDVDECAAFILQHRSGPLTSIALSLCASAPRRGAVLQTSAGVVHVDLLAGHWTLTSPTGTLIESNYYRNFNIDETYRMQLEHLARVLREEEDVKVGIRTAEQALRVALGVTSSCQTSLTSQVW